MSEIISQETVKKIDGEGMPSTEKDGKAGDLYVTFRVQFPKVLSAEQRTKLKGILCDN